MESKGGIRPDGDPVHHYWRDNNPENQGPLEALHIGLIGERVRSGGESLSKCDPRPRIGVKTSNDFVRVHPFTRLFQNSMALAAVRQREVVPPQYRTFVQYTSKR
jgi:hypothetical protein